MDKRKKRRREIAEKKRMRQEVLEHLNELVMLEESGWPMDLHMRKVGFMLGDEDERPRYLPKGLSHEDYVSYERLAAQNDVPAAVFKDRLRRKKTPLQAATEPYNRREK